MILFFDRRNRIEVNGMNGRDLISLFLS